MRFKVGSADGYTAGTQAEGQLDLGAADRSRGAADSPLMRIGGGRPGGTLRASRACRIHWIPPLIPACGLAPKFTHSGYEDSAVASGRLAAV